MRSSNVFREFSTNFQQAKLAKGKTGLSFVPLSSETKETNKQEKLLNYPKH